MRLSKQTFIDVCRGRSAATVTCIKTEFRTNLPDSKNAQYTFLPISTSIERIVVSQVLNQVANNIYYSMVSNPSRKGS